jgi:hypothetical protein
VTGRLIVGAVLAAAVSAFTPAAPAHATPQCQYGEHVTADCPSGECPDASTGQHTPCLGMVLEPMLPPPGPVKVDLEGGIGIG